jgi:hypothetical protein
MKTLKIIMKNLQETGAQDSNKKKQLLLVEGLK